MKEDAAETGFQNGSGQIGGEKLYVPASVIPLGSDLTGAFRVLPFGTQADPRGSGHGRHSICRSESAKPAAIKSVNGVFALTLALDLQS